MIDKEKKYFITEEFISKNDIYDIFNTKLYNCIIEKELAQNISYE